MATVDINKVNQALAKYGYGTAKKQSTVDMGAVQKALERYGYGTTKRTPVATTPVVQEPERKGFGAQVADTLRGAVEILSGIGDTMSYGDRTAAADVLAASKNDKLASIGAKAQTLNDTQARKGAETTRYTAARAASGAAKSAQDFINYFTMVSQRAGEQELQNAANSLAAVSALTGSEKAKQNAESMQKVADEEKEAELVIPAKFGTKYSQNVENKYDVSDEVRSAAGVAETIGYMAPAALSQYILPGSSLFVMGASAAGNAAEEALADGASKDRALTYGTAVGVLEALTEKAFDGVAGVFGKGTFDEWIEGTVKNAVKSEAGQRAVLRFVDALGEGAEEFVTELGNRLANEVIVDTDDRDLRETFSDATYSGLMGIVVSGIMQAAGSVNTSNPTEAAEAVIDNVKAAWNKGKAAISEMGAKKAVPEVGTTSVYTKKKAGATPSMVNASSEANTRTSETTEPVRPALTSDTTIAQTTPGVKSDNTTPQTQNVSNELPDTSVGAAPRGFAGDTVRGFSENIATDTAMEAELREDFQLAPEMYNRLGNKQTLEKAQEIYRRGINEATAELYGALRLSEEGYKLAPEMVPLARLVANQLTRNGDIDTARDILSRVAVELTAAGQLGQAAIILRNSGPATALETIEKALKRINDQLPANAGWRARLTEQELAELKNIDFDQDGAFDAFYEKVAERLGREMPATLREQLNEIRRVAMLLNPKTQIKNVAGNVPMLALRKTAERLSGAIQGALVKSGKMDAGDRTRTFTQSKASRDLATKLYENNVDTLKGTSNKWDMNTLMRQYRTYFGDSKAGQAADAVRLFTYEMLERGDNPFLKSAFIDGAAGYIEAQGYTDIDSIPQEVIDFAVQNALEATFKDASRLAQYLNSIKRSGSIGGDVLDILFPFTTTPINIAKRLYEYSPLSVVKIANDFKTGQDIATKVDDIAKTLTGSGVVALGFLLRAMGAITGGRDDDKDKANWDAATGSSPYSFGGRVSYDWMQPVGSTLAMGAELYDAFKGNENVLDALFNMAYSAGDSFLELSFFRDVLDLMKGYGSPTKEVIEKVATSFVSQLTPTIFGATARVFDDTVRTTYTGGTLFEDAFAQVKAKLPGASQTLPASVNVKGEENERIGNVFLRAIQEYLNPATVNVAELTEADKFIQSVYDETENKTIFPSVAGYTIEGKEQDYKLTGEERAEYQKTRGETYYDVVELLMEVSDRLTAESQADILRLANVYAGAVAKQEFLDDKGEDYTMTSDAKAMQKAIDATEEGIGFDVWFDLREFESSAKADRDKNGNAISGSKKEKMVDYIHAFDNLTDEQKDYLILAYYPANSEKAEKKALKTMPWNRD